MAQRSKFDEKYIHQARIAYAEGFTDVKFCKLIQIGRNTLHLWRKDHSDLDQAIREGKDEFDIGKVERALRKRALGYSYTEKIREPIIIGKKPERNILGEQLYVTKTIKKHMPADPTCMIFWLKNRNRDRWKDYKVTEIIGEGGGPIPILYVDANKKSA